MTIILFLHIIIEAVVGALLLFYPGAGELLPGFGDGSGSSYELLMKMYGLAALFLAGLGFAAYQKRLSDIALTYNIMLWLSIFHFAMSVLQLAYNADQRVGVLHMLLGLFMAGLYIRRPGSGLKKA